MKLLSVAIPCYNSAAYMRHCIESLLPGGDEVEILIVNDGSTKDNTGEIADEYEKRYPGICRAIHQENGGPGEGGKSRPRSRTAAMVRRSIPALGMPQVFFSRWWTVTTG